MRSICRFHSAALFTITLTLALGCDAGDDGSTEIGDATTGEGDLCESQPHSGSFIGETQVDTAYPTAAGGSIAPGTWDLVRFEVYSPATADANTRAERLIITSDTLTSIRSTNGDPDEIIGASFAVNGTELEMTVSCPTSASVTVPFTATADELWLFDPEEPNIKVYAKQ